MFDRKKIRAKKSQKYSENRKTYQKMCEKKPEHFGHFSFFKRQNNLRSEKY